MVFRDRGGRVGVLHLHCAHRGTSLEFGIPVERGIRCCYHGWVYDVDGRCLETPGEPRGQPTARARLPGRLSHARVQRGWSSRTWARPDRRPAFPIYDSYDVPGLHADAGGEVHAAVQLAPGEGQQHGPGAHRVPARAQQRLPVHRGVRRRPRAGLGADRRRHGLHRHAPGGRPGVGPRVRLHAARTCTSSRARSRRRRRPSRPAGPSIIRWAVPNDDDARRRTSSWPRSIRPGGSRAEQVAPAGLRTVGRSAVRGAPALPGRLRRAVEPADRSPSTPSSTWPRRIAASSCCGASCATASGRWRAARIRTAPGWPEGKVIRTFTQDLVVRVPPAPTPDEDRRLLRATGRQVVA